MSLLNKLTRFAKSPQGRRAMDSMAGGTATGRGRRTRGTTPTGTGGSGGMLGKVASSLLGGRRR